MISHLQTLPTENFNRHVPFQIRPLQGKATIAGERHASPCRTNSFQIIWITGGAGRILIDMSWYPIRENTLFYLTPGQVLQLGTDAQTEGVIISFTECFLGEEEVGYGLSEIASLIDQFLRHPVMQIGKEMAIEIGDITSKMLKEYNNYFLMRSEMLRRYIKIFLIHIHRQVAPAPSGSGHLRNSVLVHKFINLLEKQFKEKKMVTDYAELLSVSQSYLNKVVRKTFGYPAGHLIRQRIILEAKRKALYTDANMKEIAYSLGFEDIAHFSKFFKNTAGLNFTDFRKDNSPLERISSKE
jgi:AraC-like DNA-binding protein